MDYYQGVVNEYLRANRATFINTEYCIQLVQGKEDKGAHWYCDAVALSFSESTIYLCEVSFAATPRSLQKRLTAWSGSWQGVKDAIKRDACFDTVLAEWVVVPWLFIPAAGLAQHRLWEDAAHLQFKCKVTALEETQPWKYRTWDRKIEISTNLPE